MHIGGTLLAALGRLRRRPIRSILLLQGTIWGVAVAIFPAAVMDGTRAAAMNRGAELGADRIAITADPTGTTALELTRASLDRVLGALESAAIATEGAGGLHVRRRLRVGDPKAAPITVVEATPGGPAARGQRLAAGRWLQPEDPDDRCVVEADVAAALGKPPLVPGDRIELPGRPGALEIVGVVAPQSALMKRTDDMGFDREHGMFGAIAKPFMMAMGLPFVVDDKWKDEDRIVYVPAPARTDATLDWIYVRVSPQQLTDAADAIREAFAAEGESVLTLHPVVLPLLLGDEVERFDTVMIAMFLACLFMGAVVMANLGLLQALTRSREIAIRRVEGAQKKDIALHFLAEGFILSVIGSGLGVALGMGLAQLRVAIAPIAGFTWTLPVQHTIITVIVAVVIGTLAALLPAIAAARQDPVKGLVDE